jgi:transcriptional regulator of met regulon
LGIITVRVDEETKKKMNQLRHVNWSAVLREAIDQKLAQESNRDLVNAVITTDKLRKKAPPGWDSLEVIRFWREHRYGKSRN